MSELIHIHIPKPLIIKEIEVNLILDKFGRELVFAQCCKQSRIKQNCEVLIYEYYDSYIRCKKGKGCKR